MSERTPQKSLRPRKQPSQSRAEETVATIIEAAAQVLESEGFEGFNTNAVALRAGVSIGSLYQYFPGKDALTVALIQREGKRFHDDMALALTRRSGRAAMEYLIGATVRQQLQRPTLARLLDIEEGRPALQSAVSDGASKALFATIVKRAIPKHARLDVATDDLRAIIRAMVDAAGQRGESDIDDLEHRVRAAVFGYLSQIGKAARRVDAS